LANQTRYIYKLTKVDVVCGYNFIRKANKERRVEDQQQRNVSKW